MFKVAQAHKFILSTHLSQVGIVLSSIVSPHGYLISRSKCVAQQYNSFVRPPLRLLPLVEQALRTFRMQAELELL